MPRIPGVNHLDAVHALEKAGFHVVRQGKHIVMSDGVRQVGRGPVVPWQGRTRRHTEWRPRHVAWEFGSH